MPLSPDPKRTYDGDEEADVKRLVILLVLLVVGCGTETGGPTPTELSPPPPASTATLPPQPTTSSTITTTATATATATEPPDVTPPALAITDPVDGATITEGSYLVRGTAEPGCRVTVDHTHEVVADAGGAWEMELPVAYGDQEWTVSATDVAGNSARTAVAVHRPSAADTLAPFFAAVAALDADITAVADRFNASFDPVTVSVDPSVHVATAELDAYALSPLIPAGMSLELETAVLGVVTDLDSRIAGLAWAARQAAVERHPSWAAESPHVWQELQSIMDCLANGSRSGARFDDDLVEAHARAEIEGPPAAAQDSAEAGVLAARLYLIRLFNHGCDACGGVTYAHPFAVDWDARTIEGAEFTATYGPDGWEIFIAAC